MTSQDSISIPIEDSEQPFGRRSALTPDVSRPRASRGRAVIALALTLSGWLTIAGLAFGVDGRLALGWLALTALTVGVVLGFEEG